MSRDLYFVPCTGLFKDAACEDYILYNYLRIFRGVPYNAFTGVRDRLAVPP